jgi:hypothetical protein
VEKRKSNAVEESALELKYCERCGGLWLRPAGGEQIYCSICARAMAELPPSSTEAGRPRLPKGKSCLAEEGFDTYETLKTATDAAGGAA